MSTFLNIENLLPWRWKLFGVDFPMPLLMELYLQLGVSDFCPLTNRRGEQVELDEKIIGFCGSVESDSIIIAFVNWCANDEAFETSLLQNV